MHNNLNDSIKESEKQKANFANLCWSKKNYVSKFNKIITGIFNSKQKFFEYVINIKGKEEDADDETLFAEYEKLSDDNLTQLDTIDKNNFLSLENIKNYSIISESIKGSSGNEFFAVIERLNNQDWVASGFNLLEKEDKICPFCQQEINESIIGKLKSIFDDNYSDMLDRIKNLKSEYNEISSKNILFLKNVNEMYLESFDTKEMIELIKEYETITNINLDIINRKIKSPTKILKLKSIEEIEKKVSLTFEQMNKRINDINDIVKNKAIRKNNLKDKIDKKLKYLLIDSLKQYNKDIQITVKKIEGLNKSIEDVEKHTEEIIIELEKLTKNMSNITSIINDMNSILKSYSFINFELKVCDDNKNYKIVRSNGEKVKNSLSEGERNFISFLYFYEKVLGVSKSKDIVHDIVLVIDDPISSLDNNTMYIVSTLVKSLIGITGDNEQKSISQIILLTHNVYFYKEISTHLKGIKDNVGYYIVRKNNGISSVKKTINNTVSSTYGVLWDEIKNNDSSAQFMFNIMRRILEYYFNILGGIHYKNIIDKMDDQYKTTCSALIRSLDDNSHSITDDFCFIIDDDKLDDYKESFKKIFEQSGNIDHYNMMMRLEN